MENHMAFEFVAERDTETVRIRHNSSLIAVAKARVWASEGWSVTIVMDDQETPRLATDSIADFFHTSTATGIWPKG
jgi:hypothetical protein